MAEEGAETGAADPVGTALAMHGASREKADAFLDEQRHHIKSQFRLRQWELRLGVLLRLATAFTGLAIAAGIGFMIWNASHSSGLLIEPFSVPPDLAARGMTGEVVAAKLLDQLSQMQAE